MNTDTPDPGVCLDMNAQLFPDRRLTSADVTTIEPPSGAAADGPPGAAHAGRGDVAGALADIAAAVLALPDLEELLTRVAVLAAATIGTDSWCGITVRKDGRTFTVAASDPRAREVDEVQYGDGDGPCLQAMRTGHVVSVPDFAAATEWGPFPNHALNHGVHSSLSLPLAIDDTTAGAVNIYAGHPHAFTEAHHRDAALLAAGAAGAIGMAMRLSRQVRLSEQLQTALASRAVIDQAIGIVIRDRRCDPDQAFTYLRTVSQHRNIRVAAIAAKLVDTASRRPTPTDEMR